MCNECVHDSQKLSIHEFVVSMMPDKIQLMKATPCAIQFILCLLLQVCDNTSQIPCHYICTVRSNTNEFSSPVWANNVQECSNKIEHICACVLIEHRNCNCMNVVQNAIEMDADTIIEIRFSKMCRSIVCK